MMTAKSDVTSLGSVLWVCLRALHLVLWQEGYLVHKAVSFASNSFFPEQVNEDSKESWLRMSGRWLFGSCAFNFFCQICEDHFVFLSTFWCFAINVHSYLYLFCIADSIVLGILCQLSITIICFFVILAIKIMFESIIICIIIIKYYLYLIYWLIYVISCCYFLCCLFLHKRSWFLISH